MIVTCKKCGKPIFLAAENIGRRTSYYGDCSNRGVHYWTDREVRKDKPLFEKYLENLKSEKSQ